MYLYGGGVYVVSSENFGRNVGLLVGGLLLVDYMLIVVVLVLVGVEVIILVILVLYGY